MLSNKVYVVTDSQGDVLGVTSSEEFIRTGETPGLNVFSFELNALRTCGKRERPFVVFFKDADEDKPNVWSLYGEYPDETRTVTQEGIEVIVYAADACEAVKKVFGQMHFDSWEIAKADYWGMQS